MAQTAPVRHVATRPSHPDTPGRGDRTRRRPRCSALRRIHPTDDRRGYALPHAVRTPDGAGKPAVPRTHVPRAARDERVAEVAGIMQIEDRLDNLARELSNGLQRRVSLARALLHRPRLLLLDEPEAGLDDTALQLLDKVISEYRQDGVRGGNDDPLSGTGTRIGRPRRNHIVWPNRLLRRDLSRGTRTPSRRVSKDRAQRARGRNGLVTGSLTVAWALARKDLLLEFRSRDIVVTVAGFSDPRPGNIHLRRGPFKRKRPLDRPGVLWAGIAFAGVLGLNRSFAIETEQNALDGLMLTPVSRDLIFLGKATGNFVFLALAQAVVLPVFAVLFNQVIFRWEMLVICLLTTTGFATIGTLFAAMSIRGACKGDHVADAVPANRGASADRGGRGDLGGSDRQSWSDIAVWLHWPEHSTPSFLSSRPSLFTSFSKTSPPPKMTLPDRTPCFTILPADRAAGPSSPTSPGGGTSAEKSPLCDNMHILLRCRRMAWIA